MYTIGFFSYVAFSLLNYRIILEVDPVIIVQRAAVKSDENPFSEQSVAQVRLPSDYLKLASPPQGCLGNGNYYPSNKLH